MKKLSNFDGSEGSDVKEWLSEFRTIERLVDGMMKKHESTWYPR